MNESAEYTRLLAQAYSKLADDYSAILKREDAARAEIQKLEELLEKWMAEANRQSERADAAEDRVTFLKNRFDDLAYQIEDSRYYGKTSATGPTKFLYEIADRCRVTLELLNHVGGAE